MTGEGLIASINQEEATLPDGQKGQGLFAHLRSLTGANGGDRRDVIRTVFQGTVNRMLNGYLLRDVLNKVNNIRFTSTEEIYTLGHLYESMLKEMRDAAGEYGEFYTPRALVKFIVAVVNPRLGETVLDPACGTGGFLSEAFEHLKTQCQNAEDHRRLQRETLFGIEPKPLPYLLCQMNLLLHGMETLNIDPINALRFPLREIGDMDWVDVIITNPPFGGEEERGIPGNFPEDKQTAETALLFLQLIMRKLRRPGQPSPIGRGDGVEGGRAAVVVPNGTLFGDGVAARIKEELLKDFTLHVVVRLPNGVFAPYTSIPTNVLFFDRSGPAQDVWYYEHPLPAGRKNYTKTQPLQFEEFTPLITWWNTREENERAWKVPAAEILANGCNLDRKNPHARADITHLPPEQIAADILHEEQRIAEIMEKIRKLLAIAEIHRRTHVTATKTVNVALTLRNWLIGAYIHEYELQGQDRAEYGERLIQRLAEALRQQGVPSCERPRLYAYPTFYRVYPQVGEAVLQEWTVVEDQVLAAVAIVRSVTGQSTQAEGVETIVQSATGINPAAGGMLVERLSYTHLELLAGIDDPLKRAFYEVECIRGNWSVRELKRQIASLYFERSGLSRDKARLAELAHSGAEQTEPRLAICDPYVFEFLGLRPQDVLPEADLEAALLAKLEAFLLELGHGFCFEACQKRLLIGGEAFFVDLVFYHRLLKCHVLVELKVDEFRHEHLGQLNTYVSYYRAHEMTAGDQPPVGILLCTGTNHPLVEYALAGMDNRLFVSKYQLELPKPEELQRYIDEQRRLLEAGEASVRNGRW